MGIASKQARMLLATTAMAAFFMPAAAFAQPASSDGTGQAASSDEIVVTARRRDESVQDVPAQVTVLNASAIQTRGIERPADFIAQVPNVTFVETQNAGTSFLVIRGISQARNSEPSAAIVVDGVPMTQPAQFNQALIDIEQIEVDAAARLISIGPTTTAAIRRAGLPVFAQANTPSLGGLLEAIEVTDE